MVGGRAGWQGDKGGQGIRWRVEKDCDDICWGEDDMGVQVWVRMAVWVEAGEEGMYTSLMMDRARGSEERRSSSRGEEEEEARWVG